MPESGLRRWRGQSRGRLRRGPFSMMLSRCLRNRQRCTRSLRPVPIRRRARELASGVRHGRLGPIAKRSAAVVHAPGSECPRASRQSVRPDLPPGAPDGPPTPEAASFWPTRRHMTIGPHSCSSTSARIAVAGRIHGSQIAAAVLLVLAGCASSPLTAVPPSGDGVELPATWSATKLHTAGLPDTAAAPLTDWWLRFDDPLLDTLVRRALQANTSVKTAQAALLQAQALRDEAAAALWPTLSATASAQQGTADGHRTGNVVQAGVSASWVPDVFGAHRSALAASRATVQASAASAGDVQGTIAAEVALSYVVLRSGQARLAIAGDNLASQEETLQITQWRQQAGLATLLDVEQQRAAVEQTRALVPAQQAGIAQAQHALAVLCGRPPGGLADLLTPPRAVPQDTADFTPDIPAQTLRQRADVRAGAR